MTLRVINVISRARRALPLLPRFRTYCCVAPLGDQLANARRGDRRDVTRLQPQIHDGLRNAAETLILECAPNCAPQ